VSAIESLPQGWSWSVYKREQGATPFVVTLSFEGQNGVNMVFGHGDTCEEADTDARRYLAGKLKRMERSAAERLPN
jgi:hypothetical protein